MPGPVPTSRLVEVAPIEADDVDRAHPARVYAHWLGSKDTYVADRALADQISTLAPWIAQGAKANRAFLARSVTHLADAGITQVLDLGTGLPATPNVHEIAQATCPAARTCYIDNDPIVVAHARARLARDTRTIAVQADIRDPDSILDNPIVRAHLDFSRPVGVLMIAVLHFVDDPDPARIMKAFREMLVPGSFVVITHVADLGTPVNGQNTDPSPSPAMNNAALEAARLYREIATPFFLRTPNDIQALFAGLDLLAPGMVPVSQWGIRTRPTKPGTRRMVAPILAGVGRVNDGSREGTHYEGATCGPAEG
jgi:hypothetical protein